MEKIRKEATDIEKVELEEDGKISPIYGSTLTDVMILEWQDLHDPWEWISSDEELHRFFEECFALNAKIFKHMKLVRGTDNSSLHNLNPRDVVDYSNRYTSWSTEISVCCNFTDIDSPTFLVYEGEITAFELISNKSEKEFIISPCKFLIVKTLSVSSSEESEIQAELVKRVLSGGIFTGNGKIHIVKLVDNI